MYIISCSILVNWLLFKKMERGGKEKGREGREVKGRVNSWLVESANSHCVHVPDMANLSYQHDITNCELGRD